MVITVDDVELVVGVDTHLDTHTAAICDSRGRPIAELQVPTTPAGYERLLDWVHEAAEGGRVAWAVEGTRHYGIGLARFLTENGQVVMEIDRSRHVGKRRAGKNDPIDALRAANEVVARPANSTPRADGARDIPHR